MYLGSLLYGLLVVVASGAGTHCANGFSQHLEGVLHSSASQGEFLRLVVVAMSIATELNSVSIAIPI